MSRIPSLDGLRAISILLVIGGHLANRLGRAGHPRVLAIFGNGGLGVEVFFVISGYLITSILLREFDKTSGISLPKFYFRRSMRIFPAFYAYILGALFFCSQFLWPPPSSDIAAAALYTMDYASQHRFWIFEHTWSLSVEEQFYILWPTILLVLLRWKGKRAAAIFCASMFAFAPLFRLVSSASGSKNLYFMLHTREDALMIGCLVAVLAGTSIFESIYRAVAPFWPVGALFVLFASPLLELRFGGKYIYLVGMTVECAAIALSMLWLIRNSKSLPGRILNWMPLVKIGALSYSIYLWQELFLHPANTTTFARFPLCLVMIAGCSILSYYVVEQPFLWLRERLEEGWKQGESLRAGKSA